MNRVIVTASILALLLSACARLDGGERADLRDTGPAYVPTQDSLQAPLFSDATVTGDTIHEE